MLLAKAKDPAFWEKVRTSDAYKPLVDELFSLWGRLCEGDIPACKYSEYVLYNITGSRVEYEQSYFRRRRIMNTSAILSLIYPEEEKYFTKLCDVIWAILDEYNWVLPAHIRNFKDNVVAYLDLFASETGFALSEIDYIFGERLPQLIRSRIRAEIEERIIDAYTGDQRYWWEDCNHNWAAVCIGSIGSTFLYMHPERFEEIRPRVEETIRCFLSGFPEDGMCLEGFGYWHYGFGFFVYLADLLREFTGGEIDYFRDPKVRLVAKFIQSMFLTDGATVSFADSGMSGRYHLGLLHYLKNEYPDDIRLLPREKSYAVDECGRWAPHLRAFLWFDETLETEKQIVEENREFYAYVSQWLIRWNRGYSFAAKGGTNAELHNHNDIGSFIVAKGDAQILCDPGAGSYHKGYFGPNRYDLFHTSSRGHSVPIVGGEYQKPGAEYRGESSYEDGVFTVEMHRAYGIAALTKLERQFSFTDDCVTVHDGYAFDGAALPVTERFVTRFPAEITPDGVVTGGLTLTADGGTVSISQEQEGFWFIDYALDAGTESFTLTVRA